MTNIRIACALDANAIAELTAQLGYDVTASTVAERLSRILSRPDQRLLVADVDGQPVGWIHAAITEYVDSGPFVVIGGLVVDTNHRKSGVGRALMMRAEEWAREQKIPVVRLSSSTGRTNAHQFYERIGYKNIKTQYSFLKSLNDTGEDVARFVPRI